MDEACATSSAVDGALKLDIQVIWDFILQHLPDLHDYVSLSPPFKRIHVELLDGFMVVLVDTIYFPEEGLLYLFKSLDVTFCHWSP